MNGPINALSHEFNRAKTALSGVDAAAIGQGVYSVVETAALAALTGPLGPEIAAVRYGRTAMMFNSAAKVAPVAAFMAGRQASATYDDAIRRNFNTDQAEDLALKAGSIGFLTTLIFSAAGAGGVEGIASGAARQALRESLRGTARSALRESLMAGGKGLLGEMAEEQIITALDTALVQAEFHPGMTAEDFQRAVYETAVVTFIGSGGFAVGHGKHAYDDTLAGNARVANESVLALEQGDTSVDGVIDGQVETAPTAIIGETGNAIATAEGVATPAADTAAANGGTSAPIVSETTFGIFTRSATDPAARVPDSEKIHRNIDIVRSRTGRSSAPLDISSNEVAPQRDAFDRTHRAADGFEVRKEFIPATTETEARAEYARRHGHAAPQAGWKALPATAWLDGEGASIISFRDAQERDAWRGDQIRSRHIIENRGNDPSEPAGITYEEALKEHPFLDVMATIRHDSAKLNVQTGTFSMTSSQGGRTYELKGDISESNIHIRGLFPVGEDSNKSGTNSFGSDFLVTVLAFSRQMPGMTITANAARDESMNGYAI